MTWETRLLDHFAEHVATEALVLDSYEELARSAGSAYVEYLVRLIADDERRHHRIFTELTNTLRSQTGSDAAGPGVPGVTDEPTGDDFLALTERFIAMERRDAVELERLRRELRGAGRSPGGGGAGGNGADAGTPDGDGGDGGADAGDGLWGLLVDMMHLDTQKHLRILNFIRDRSLERRRRDDGT